jgi:hypothetical protein
MRSDKALRDELRRVVQAKEDATDDATREEMYGAEQALAWALGQDAAPPSVLAGRAGV